MVKFRIYIINCETRKIHLLAIKVKAAINLDSNFPKANLIYNFISELCQSGSQPDRL